MEICICVWCLHLCLFLAACLCVFVCARVCVSACVPLLVLGALLASSMVKRTA